ncbi:MAG TPA: hypothetical protein VGD29_24200 [Actinoplanes sp.]
MTTATWARRAAAALIALVAGLAVATPARAYPPVDIVHTERVTAGPYHLTVGFSTWPIRAMRSLDFTFMPDGGIAGKSGYLTISGSGHRAERRHSPLVRHPRKRDAWGLDVLALDRSGTYSFGFEIDGPQGHGEGTLTGVEVLRQPGPPLAISWTVGSLPGVALIVLIAVAWWRTRPAKQPLFA